MNERILEILRDERAWLSEARIAAKGGWRSRVHVRLQLLVLERDGHAESQKVASDEGGALWRYVSPAVKAMAEATPTPRRRSARAPA